MRRVSRIERRRMVRCWFAWVVLPLFPFSVLFFDTWLNIQVRQKDYELGQLNLVKRALDNELDMVRAQEARMNGIDHLTEIAGRMGLEPPGIQQFQVVMYEAAPPPAQPLNIGDFQMAPLAPTSIVLDGGDTMAMAQKPEMSPPLSLVPDTPVTGFSPQTIEPLATLETDDELSLLTVEDMLAKL